MFDFNVAKVNSSRLNKTIKENKEKLTPKVDLNAVYIGIVEDTNDPRGLGRIKVRIPALHGTNSSQAYYMPTKQIPWASPALLNGGTNDMGQYIIPIKGSQVMITFELNSFNKPVYLGTVPSNTNGNVKYYNDNDMIYNGNKVDINSNDRIRDLNNNSSEVVRASNNRTDKQKMSTGKTVIYKSLKGATIMIDDEDGNESIVFMDANGQTLKLGNNSGTALPRRGNRVIPSSGAKPYMSLSNGLGDAVSVTKGKVNIKTSGDEQIDLSEGKIKVSTSSDDILLMKDGDISLTNSNGDIISLKNGKINIETSNGEVITLDSNKINIESGNNKIKLDGTKVEMTNGTSNMKLDGTTASIDNGSGSVTIGSGGVSINNGTATMSFSGSAAYIGSARLWDDTYHPGVQ